MIKLLIIIFVLLSMVTGGDRTAKAMMTTIINISIFAVLIELIFMGFNIALTTIAASILISAVTIFYQNEKNIKTKAAFIAVVSVLAFSSILILFVISRAHLQGFGTIGDVKIHESNGYSEDIGINMLLVEVSVFVIMLIGGLIDTAMAISSGIYELSGHNPASTKNSLFISGMNIGHRILSSNINTLFFIFAGEFMIMCISLLKFYSWSILLNSKDFAQAFIAIVISALGTVIIIPVASFISSAYMSKASSTPD